LKFTFARSLPTQRFSSTGPALRDTAIEIELEQDLLQRSHLSERVLLWHNPGIDKDVETDLANDWIGKWYEETIRDALTNEASGEVSNIALVPLVSEAT
jgi:hypothetical protein